MERSATQHAGIAAESVNGLNGRMLATLKDQADADMVKVKDAYEAVASLKLLTQRLGLTYEDLPRVLERWGSEGRLTTTPDTDADAQAAAFRSAMTDAKSASREMFAALDRATEALGPVGWRKDTGVS